MEVIEVDDAADPRLDDFRDLMDADVRPDRRGIVIAEGVNVVTRLARSAYPMRAVIGVRKKLDALVPELLDRDVPAYQCDKWLLSDVVGFRVTRGVLAAASRPPAADPDRLLSTARRIAVLEGLNDFENLGALFRNAAAFGVDAVLLDPHLRRSALPAQRAGVDGPRAAGAVRGAARLVAGRAASASSGTACGCSR